MASVLVVDDEPDIAESYEMWLQADHEVTVATSGEAALDAIDESIDVVLLDRRMPKMTGDEILDKIADWDVEPSVVLVTAVDPEFEIVESEFDMYLRKPVMRDGILGAVESVLERGDYREPDGESSWPSESEPQY